MPRGQLAGAVYVLVIKMEHAGEVRRADSCIQINELIVIHTRWALAWLIIIKLQIHSE